MVAKFVEDELNVQPEGHFPALCRKQKFIPTCSMMRSKVPQLTISDISTTYNEIYITFYYSCRTIPVRIVSLDHETVTQLPTESGRSLPDLSGTIFSHIRRVQVVIGETCITDADDSNRFVSNDAALLYRTR